MRAERPSQNYPPGHLVPFPTRDNLVGPRLGRTGIITERVGEFFQGRTGSQPPKTWGPFWGAFPIKGPSPKLNFLGNHFLFYFPNSLGRLVPKGPWVRFKKGVPTRGVPFSPGVLFGPPAGGLKGKGANFFPNPFSQI